MSQNLVSEIATLVLLLGVGSRERDGYPLLSF